MVAFGFLLMWSSAVYLFWSTGVFREWVDDLTDGEVVGASVFVCGLAIVLVGVTLWLEKILP